MTVETTRKQIKTAASEMATGVAEASAAAAAGFADGATAAIRGAGAAAESLYGRGTEARDYAMRLVAANPLSAILVAGAIGFAIASRIGRR